MFGELGGVWLSLFFSTKPPDGAVDWGGDPDDPPPDWDGWVMGSWASSKSTDVEVEGTAPEISIGPILTSYIAKTYIYVNASFINPSKSI